MRTDFRVTAIEKDALPDLATLSEAERERLDAVSVMADTRPGYPCRVSLVEAVEYLHIHNANPGCFNCSVRRA